MDIKTIVKLADRIKSGKAGVIPTDTVYGLIVDALKPELVESLYILTGRPTTKPFIILIGSLAQLDLLGIEPSVNQKESASNIWPGPVSIIFDCPRTEMEYLHRGNYSLAVRLPNQPWLRTLVNKTGPLIATSANPSGVPTSKSIKEIKKQLPGLDFYIEGETSDTPSKLVKISNDGSMQWISRS